MGLDVSYNCWSGPYSTFNRFRYSLGHQIGIDLSEYKGYNREGGTKELYGIEHDLMPLFNHSDCDGRLTIKECKSILKGFDDILENYNEEIETDYNFKEMIIQFKEGLSLAISHKKMVYFK